MPARYLETLEVPPDQLQPYPGNAKLHDGPALEESVRRNGQFRAVLARRLPDGTLQLLAGHGTTTAVHQAGAGPVRVEIVAADDDDARRIVLADNALGARAGYDEQALLDLLDEAKANGGFPGTGYDEDVYRELADKLHEPLPDFAPEDEDANPRLDQLKPIECPSCGHEFTPAK